MRTRLAAGVLVLAWLCGPGGDAQGQPKRLYIANDDHTDWFWSGTDVEYAQAFQDMLDYYMQQAEDTSDLPADSRGRFNCDGSLWIHAYESARGAADVDRLRQHVVAGNISVPFQSLVLLPGAMPTEAVLRDMYYAGELERRWGLDLDLAVVQENQTLPAGIASLWAGSGARFSWRGVCGCATKTPYRPRPREIYRFRGADGQGVLLKWNEMLDDSEGIGGYAEARDPFAAVLTMDGDPAFLDRWPWPVAAAFGYGWDDFQSTTDRFVQASLQLSDETRRVIVSNQQDFFEDFLVHHGAETPIFSGSLGNEWDLYTASLAAPTAAFRREIERLRTAEALAATIAHLDPTLWSSRSEDRRWAHLHMGLFYEHDWVANGPVPAALREQWQRDVLAGMQQYVGDLLEAARAGLAQRVANPDGSERHLVFNPLSFERTDVALIEGLGPGPWHVVDVLSGVELPSEPVPGGGLWVLVPAVPPVGYRVVELRGGEGQGFEDAATVNGTTLDNGRVRVTLGANGALTSLIEADGGRELVAPGEGLAVLAAALDGSVVVEQVGPVSATLRVEAGGAPAHTTRVTLWRGLPRVEIVKEITQNFGHTVVYDFSFDLADFTVRHEELGMVATVGRAADGGDYADLNTRTDYLTLNHFVDLSEAGFGITLSDADGSFMRVGDSTVDLLDTSQPRVHTVVGMQVDGPGLGFANQGGDDRFENRYALLAHGGFDPATAMRFALEHQNPLVTARVMGTGTAPLPPAIHSLLDIGSADVLLWALKPAEDPSGGELVVRVWNLAEESRLCDLGLADGSLLEAQRLSHVESHPLGIGVAGGRLYDGLAPQQLATYQLRRESGVGRAPAARTRPLRVRAEPNPFNPRVRLHLEQPRTGDAQVEIFDARGRRVRTLHRGPLPAGSHTLVWDGRDEGGRPVGSGLYLVRHRAGGRQGTRKIALVR